MDKAITKKRLAFGAIAVILFTVIAWMYPEGYYQLAMENEFIKSVKEKLTAYNKQVPEDRLYVQMDKPMYSPGETMWLSVFVRNGQTLKPSKKSDIIHVELINPKGTIEKTINLIATNGVAGGDFELEEAAVGGQYKLRAYTNWMKNEGADNKFEKEITVQEIVLPNLKMKLDFEKKAFGAGDEVIAKLNLNTNENKPLSNYSIRYVSSINGEQILSKTETTDENGEKFIHFTLPANLTSNDGLLNVMIDYNGSTESISRSIPIVLNKISVELFPEGGDLVTGLEGTVAFRALNEFGKPADIEGVVLTEKGSQVSSFSSYHMGMGAFTFNPQPNEKYHVKITKPEGIKASYPLPEALPNGFAMNIDNRKKGEIGVTINSTETEEVTLLAQVRGKIYYSTIINATKGKNKIIFPTSAFPVGVTQITLFDSKGTPRAERLAFVNKDKQLNISVTTTKEKYLPREKVTMTINVKDDRGMPMPANLSMAVVNDQLLSFADDKQGNILSQLLLQEDLEGKVEEPAFYFDKKEPKADLALDYLLMTSGWRRFTWEKVMSGQIPAVTWQGERAVLSGTVLDAYSYKPVPNAKLQINNGVEYQADANGNFTFTRLDLSKTTTLTLGGENYNSQTVTINNYAQDQTYYIYPEVTSPTTNYTWSNPNVNENVQLSAAPSFSGASAPEQEVVLLNDRWAGEGMGKKDKIAVQKSATPKPSSQPKDANKAGPPPPDQQAEKKALAKEEDAPNEKQNIALRSRDVRAEFFRAAADSEGSFDNDFMDIAAAAPVYYCKREFAAPVYTKNEIVETRTDFRNTIYWNPNIAVDNTGRKVVEFYTSDDITSFRTTVEGLGTNGTIGRTEKNFFTQLPFAMSTKVPVEVATEDHVSIPLTLKNNTDAPLGGTLTISNPEGMKSMVEVPSLQTIMPGKAKVIYLDYEVLDKIGESEITIAFKACGLGDAFTQKIKIAPKGFPVSGSFSGQEKEKEFRFTTRGLVKGSLKINFTAFPNVVSDLMAGVAGILREPYGCFEQTSCSAYPNAMVLDYLHTTDSKDDATISKANDLLNRGYKRLTTFEAPDKGYEWFGANPGHEGLTAYGIMEFTDMKKAGGDVDQGMIDRSANWLMSHRDGKGGFKREQHAYHDFGRISDDILNAYIVFALAESGYTDIKKEFEASYNKANETKDPYMLAMMANAAYSLKDNSKGDALMNTLIEKQAKDGSFTGATHSITYSQGQSLTIESTSLAILAMIKSPAVNGGALTNAVQFLVGSRSGSGVFSSTQGTILALKALTEYAKFSKKTTEDGTIEIYVDNKKVETRNYKAGDKGAIEIDSLENAVSGEGEHVVKVKFVGVKNPLPYSVAVNYSTSLPNSNPECALGLTTKLSATNAFVGETVRLTSVITNRKKTDIPSTMAIIGIPAGFTVQPWQLKEMQEKKIFDYYEIKGNNLAIYYRGMEASAVKEINLDLKAEIPGTFDAPASSAYLYYTNEFKTWSSVEKVSIRKNAQ
ncbi:MAG: MG2 domain-containing protein [Bacteroidota bacterium]|nr:MG2 domain-containing protein [Bacteroidota bacterium]